MQAGPPDGVVPEGHPKQFGIVEELSVQVIAKITVEKALVVLITEWKASRVTGDAGVGTTAVKDHIF
ncbi:MAG: hypothetical protein VX213_00810, partial [Chloroflexota bacterium]|nr:hypothetical protein [Chloroflexota bacterium]